MNVNGNGLHKCRLWCEFRRRELRQNTIIQRALTLGHRCCRVTSCNFSANADPRSDQHHLCSRSGHINWNLSWIWGWLATSEVESCCTGPIYTNGQNGTQLYVIYMNPLNDCNHSVALKTSSISFGNHVSMDPPTQACETLKCRKLNSCKLNVFVSPAKCGD